MNKQEIVNETLLTRRSIRAYQATPVPQNIMDVILRNGTYAPSGMNRQPWEIRVVSDTKYLKGITNLYLESLDEDERQDITGKPNFRNMFRNAPTVVFIGMKENPCSQVDCGLLAGNMVNTAWAYGIGSCIQMAPVRFMNTEIAQSFVDQLEFSEDYKLFLAIGFGYPDETPEAKPREKDKIKYLF